MHDTQSSEADRALGRSHEDSKLFFDVDSPSEPSEMSSSISKLPSIVLPFSTCLAFGLGTSGIYVNNLILSFFLTPFLLETAGISPFAAGNILLIGNIWDAFTDPIVGWLSDQTPFPRRKPYILVAFLPACFFYFLFWVVPGWNVEYLGFYYCLIYLLRTVFFTSVVVPMNSLGAEVSHDYDQRTRLQGYRWSLSLVSGLIFVTLQSFLIEVYKNPSQPDGIDYEKGYLLCAFIIAIFTAIDWVIFLIGVKEVPQPVAQNVPKIGAYKSILVCFKNGPFLIVVAMYSLSYISFALITNNMFLYVKYVLLEEDFYQTAIFVIMGASTISLPLWTIFTKHFGKKFAFCSGTSLIIVFLLPAVFLPEHVVWPIYICGTAAGIGLSAGFLVPNAMLPDVIEYDELKTNSRREGTFFAIFFLIEKMGVAISTSLSNYALGLSGYINPRDQTYYERSQDYQPDSAKITLRVLVGFVPVILMLVSVLACCFYPINRAKHQEIVHQLEVRKSSSSTVPIPKDYGTKTLEA